MVAERDALEAEIEGMRRKLAESGCGEAADLVDAEGFPRSDVDVAQIRQNRNKLACLYTDHKELSAKIEQAIHELHAGSKDSGASSPSPATAPEASGGRGASGEAATPVQQQQQQPQQPPFALVDEVLAGGPAERAGLAVGDQLLRFGTIDAASFAGNLHQVAEHARASENAPVKLGVLRAGQALDLDLVPQAWAGSGVLGCHMRVL